MRHCSDAEMTNKCHIMMKNENCDAERIIPTKRDSYCSCSVYPNMTSFSNNIHKQFKNLADKSVTKQNGCYLGPIKTKSSP